MKSKLLLALIIILAVSFIVGIIFAIAIAANRIDDSITTEETTQPTEEVFTLFSTEATPDQAQYPYENKNAMDYEANTDMKGWLSIADTGIDYPVMQTPNYPDYYLVRDFFNNSSTYGCPYVQSNCDLKKPSDNILIYSHYMKDGTMFAELEKYKNKEFFDKHKTITFEIDGKVNQYEIMSVVVQPFTTDDEKTFKFYEFVDAYDPQSFNQFVSNSKALSLYDTGVNAKYGDKLLTLATSEYNSDNERFIVIAMRK